MKFTSILESFVKNKLNQIDDNLFYINNITENDFNHLNTDQEYIILKPNEITRNLKIYKDILVKEKFEIIITSIGNISYDDLFVKNTDISFVDAYYDPNEKGIIFLKKRNPDLIKKYDTIRDLNRDDIGLLIDNKKNNRIRIVGYEINQLLNPISTIQEKSILFYGEITTGIVLPYDSSRIVKTVSRIDVNGKQILYPLAAYFADNSILISDRLVVSHYAKRVWKDFFATSNILFPFAPIDNQEYPLTPQTIDDGEVYTDIKKDLKEIILKYFDPEIKKLLLKLLECENLNDLLKIQDEIKFNDIKDGIKSLIETTYIDQGTIFKFIYDLIIDNFKINLPELRNKKYLDWAYKVNPNLLSSIKNIVTKLISNHVKVSIKHRDPKILEYATNLWEKRGSGVI